MYPVISFTAIRWPLFLRATHSQKQFLEMLLRAFYLLQPLFKGCSGVLIRGRGMCWLGWVSDLRIKFKYGQEPGYTSCSGT